MNKVVLEGRLGKDPEMTYLPNGTGLCKVSLATSNDYKDKKIDEWVKKEASWHNIIAFGNAADALAAYHKGDKVKVDGKVTYRKWEDKAGQKRETTEIQVFQVGGEEATPF